MSQRRSTSEEKNKPSSRTVAVLVEEGDLTLDGVGVGVGVGDATSIVGSSNSSSNSSSNNNNNNNNNNHNNNNDMMMTPLSIDEQYSRDRYAAKVKQWKDSPFAVGLTEANWYAESSTGTFASSTTMSNQQQYHEFDPDSAGCLCCSRLLCRRAGRVGNMAILHQTQEWVEEVVVVPAPAADNDDDNDNDEENNGAPKTTRRYTRPKLVWMMGPYWPMLLFVTYPLILGVSGWTLISVIFHVPFIVQFIWTILTVGLIYALAMTAFRDPGILYRHDTAPDATWRWNDAALTYRPRNAFYDPDCGVVVEDFDHTCPWTGTAIGKRNMLAFQFFVGLVFVCLIMDIVLLSGAFALIGNN